MSIRAKRGLTPLYIDTNVKRTRDMPTTRLAKNKRKYAKTGLNMKLPYSEGVAGSIAALGLRERIFRGNGMFDPDVALGGHQPLGFDQANGLYDRHYVRGSDIKVKLANGNFLGYGGWIAVWPDVSSTSYTLADWLAGTVQEVCTKHGGKILPLSQYQTANMYMKRSTSSMIGRKDDDQLGSRVADPVDQWYWHVLIVNLDTTGSINVSDECVINYDAEFTEPRTEVQS